MRSGDFNPALLLDAAMQHLPDEQLAAALRKLEDADLANMVRQEPALRRFVLMMLLNAISEVGDAAGREYAVAKKRARATDAAKPAKTPRARQADADESEDGLGDDHGAAIAGAVEEAGADGTTGKAICEELKLPKHVVGHRLRQLVDSNKVRKEGNGRGSRYFAA